VQLAVAAANGARHRPYGSNLYLFPLSSLHTPFDRYPFPLFSLKPLCMKGDMANVAQQKSKISIAECGPIIVRGEGQATKQSEEPRKDCSLVCGMAFSH
jgi:hypothetical protein